MIEMTSDMLDREEHALMECALIGVEIVRAPVTIDSLDFSGCTMCRWHAVDASGDDLDGAHNPDTLLDWHLEGHFTMTRIQRVSVRRWPTDAWTTLNHLDEYLTLTEGLDQDEAESLLTPAWLVVYASMREQDGDDD